MARRRKAHAFKQAPWRLQMRFSGNTMLAIIALLTVGGMYLAINARLARAGRRVLELQNERANLMRQYSEYASTLAELTSPDQMLEKAIGLDFEPAGPGDIRYVLVEGYTGVDPFVAPRPPSAGASGEETLSPAYTETLGEWLKRWFSLDSGGGN
jgi:hypothetical protein